MERDGAVRYEFSAADAIPGAWSGGVTMSVPHELRVGSLAEMPKLVGDSYTQIIDQLLMLPDDKYVSFPVNGSAHRVRAAVQQAARWRGLKVGTRLFNGELFVYRSQRPGRQASERDETIVERRVRGETLQSIADTHGITRERVRQIVNQQPMLRNAKRDGFVAPYISRNLAPRCFACRAEIGEKSKALCATCRKRATIIRRIQWCLANREASRQHVSSAIYLIRKHDIKPEDLGPERL